jgi:hypothetical protein
VLGIRLADYDGVNDHVAPGVKLMH